MDPDELIVSYEEFLGLARDEGVIGLDVVVVQGPRDDNGQCAVVVATARTAHGGFSAIGEASPATAPARWGPFLTTLAELRAKARALREVTGLEHGIDEESAAPYLPAPSSDPGRSQRLGQMPATGREHGAQSRVVAMPAPPNRAVPPRPPSAPEPGEDDQIDISTERSEPAPLARAGAWASEPENQAPDEAAVAHPDGPDAAYEEVGRDMEAKLLKLAMSIAVLEDGEITESEARQKLDDFFMRAFKHPLSKGTRMEGQRVVQRLSGDLVRLRAQGQAEKD